MTRAEAEIYIWNVIGPGDVMSVDDIRRRYRDRTLSEALEDYLGPIARYCEIDPDIPGWQ